MLASVDVTPVVRRLVATAIVKVTLAGRAIEARARKGGHCGLEETICTRDNKEIPPALRPHVLGLVELPVTVVNPVQLDICAGNDSRGHPGHRNQHTGNENMIQPASFLRDRLFEATPCSCLAALLQSINNQQLPPTSVQEFANHDGRTAGTGRQFLLLDDILSTNI